VEYITEKQNRTGISSKTLLRWLGIARSKYYDWLSRDSFFVSHNGQVPKSHWILEWEKYAIVQYALSHQMEGYRRLTYMMLDENVVAVSPSSVYRVLKKAGLLNRWNMVSSSLKGQGFIQPEKFNEHWHIDIKYVNFKGTFLFLIAIIDGYTRYKVHHELRTHMQESDVEIVVQRAIEKYPDVKPRLISDNGSQFISKDFTSYMKNMELKHVRTSVRYPQSNGKIERFHRTVHQECLQQKSLINLEDARRQVAEFIEFYNTKRLHSSLYYLTPDDYVKNKVEKRLDERRNKLAMAKMNRLFYRNAV
jgi:transposase InsO family protein